MEGNQLFPVFIKLDTIHTLLIGAGPIGLEKLTAILDNSPHARVTVVASAVSSELRVHAADFDRVKVVEKTFEPSDLDGIDLVVAATNNAVLNEEVRQLAQSRNLLANFADKPELCNFYLGSVVKKGDLKIAISTNGKSPTIAKRLKEVLNDSLPNELNDTLQNMQSLRNTLSGDFAYKVKKLNEVTASLVGTAEVGNQGSLAIKNNGNMGLVSTAHTPTKDNRVSLKWLIWLAVVFSFAIVITAFWIKEPEFQAFVENINPIFYWFL
ncbi:MAG: bifunctional precorrin-2 dehydrogenase/sirohydrochlorin ferrochelatase, partial [Pedobacter sp.]